MAIDLYTTHELREMVEIAQPNAQFFVNAFFNPIVEFDREYITFDVMNEKDTLAPFVSPCTAGKPNNKSGYETKSIKPPYIKIKDHVEPCDVVKRAPGEAIGGGLSLQERYDREINRLLAEQSRRIERRMEWMCAGVLVDGKFTVSGDDVPEIEIDYKRDPDNQLPPAVLWDQATADPLSDLEDWSGQILDQIGVGGTDVVLDPLAWKLFRKNDEVKELLDIRNGYQGSLDISPAVAAKNYFKGTVGGFNIWVYNDTYLDDDGNRQKMIPDNTAIMVAAQEMGLDGYRAFGAIKDVSGLAPAAIFTKMWNQEDPSATCLLSQSAGVPVASRINGTYRATVA